MAKMTTGQGRGTPKQQVLMLLDECLRTGIRGRVAAIIKQAKAEIEGQGTQDDAFFRRVNAHTPVNGCPGLMLKVGQRHRRWVYRYTPSGASSTRQITLGYFPAVGVDEAKALWRDHREGLSAGMTFERLLDRYLAYARANRRDWRREQSLLERRILPHWRTQLAASITAADVQQLLGALAQAPHGNRAGDGRRSARDALALLRHLFDVARGKVTWPDPTLPWIPAQQANPCEGVSIERPVTFPSLLPLGELVSYHKALLSLPINERLRPLLQLQLMLLCPLSVLCRLLWDKTDLQRGRAVVPMADGTQRVLYLTPASSQILQQQRRHCAHSPWVFPALKHPDRPMPVRYPSQMMKVVRHHLSLSDQFTASGIVKLGQGFFRRQGSVMGQYDNPVSVAQDNPLTQEQLQKNLVSWQQHLADLRISG